MSSRTQDTPVQRFVEWVLSRPRGGPRTNSQDLWTLLHRMHDAPSYRDICAFVNSLATIPNSGSFPDDELRKLAAEFETEPPSEQPSPEPSNVQRFVEWVLARPGSEVDVHRNSLLHLTEIFWYTEAQSFIDSLDNRLYTADELRTLAADFEPSLDTAVDCTCTSPSPMECLACHTDICRQCGGKY